MYSQSLLSTLKRTSWTSQISLRTTVIFPATQHHKTTAKQLRRSLLLPTMSDRSFRAITAKHRRVPDILLQEDTGWHSATMHRQLSGAPRPRTVQEEAGITRDSAKRPDLLFEVRQIDISAGLRKQSRAVRVRVHNLHKLQGRAARWSCMLDTKAVRPTTLHLESPFEGMSEFQSEN